MVLFLLLEVIHRVVSLLMLNFQLSEYLIFFFKKKLVYFKKIKNSNLPLLRYRVESFSPPYIYATTPRPTIISLQSTSINNGRINVNYGQKVIMVIKVESNGTPPNLKAIIIIHRGFVHTHKILVNVMFILKLQAFCTIHQLQINIF